MVGFLPVTVEFRFRVDSRTGRWTGALAWPRTPTDPPVWPDSLASLTLFVQWMVQRALVHGVPAYGLGCGMLVLVDVDSVRDATPQEWVRRLPPRTVALLPENEAVEIAGAARSRIPHPRGPRLHVTRDRDDTVWLTAAHPDAADGDQVVWSGQMTSAGLATPNQRTVPVDDPPQTVAHGFHPDLIDLTGAPVPRPPGDRVDLTDPDRARRP